MWIGGNGAGDSHILKFTQDGKFIAQYGKQNVHKGPANAEGLSTYPGDSNDPNNFGRVAKVTIDGRANEAYVADGYLNKRVAVLDVDSGKMKRYWGAYGNKPDDKNLGPYDPDAPPAQQFRNPVHCAELSIDGLVYVCDRVNDRIQVFQKDGKFVKEQFIARRSLAEGSVWDIAFSKDPQQTYIYLADGRNMKVHILRRDTLEELTAFGDGGRQPGQFFGVHSIAVDSKGNIYTTETYEGKRIQKFVYKGIGTVPRTQGRRLAAQVTRRPEAREMCITMIRSVAVSVLVATLVFAAEGRPSGQVPPSGGNSSAVVPFKIRVPDAVLADLRQRLSRARFGDELPNTGWDYGTNVAYLKVLVDYWRDRFDWRAQERRLNQFDQFKTTIDGLAIHFIHQRSKVPNAMPLLLLNGWPSSIMEYEKVIAPLTDPVAFGGRAEDAFDVVIPVMPGFGFSDKPRGPGFQPERIAGMWIN